LDLPTLTVARFNLLIAGFFGQLVAARKVRMQAAGEDTRKLVMI
jgi:hypothetical protein